MLEEMTTPRTRSDFERGLFMAKEQRLSGRIRVAPHLARLVGGINSIRTLPNGRIDLSTVDEMARLDANMAVNMSDRWQEMMANAVDKGFPASAATESGGQEKGKDAATEVRKRMERKQKAKKREAKEQRKKNRRKK